MELATDTIFLPEERSLCWLMALRTTSHLKFLLVLFWVKVVLLPFRIVSKDK
jgi:hypothetical protein